MIREKISHYEVLKKLGSGGMGEIFQARDTILDRIVALKILPEQVASDPKRMRRFEQEAKAASSLNHPNVAHIYEIGESDGVHFIGMEYIEGCTLESRIAEGPGTSKEIVEIGSQIADTLAEAHTKGIIHRDVKPSNIMLTTRGQVKVLDFGLARLSETEDPDFSKLTTKVQTESGVMLGTIPYFSPEQALGRPIDGRSDLFSLGIVLYEMATGRRPFSGATATATIDQIIHQTPEPVSRLNYAILPGLEQIIFKCLRKDPAERYQTAGDLVADFSSMKREMADGVQRESVQSEYFLSRTTARILFVLLQIMYISFYVATYHWSDGMQAGLNNVLPDQIAQFFFVFFLFSAMPGIAARLYFISMNVLDHAQTGVQFRKAFPFLWLLDVFWAVAPFGLSLKISPVLCLACIPPLVFSPFSQRTLIASAYHLQTAGRISTSPGPNR